MDPKIIIDAYNRGENISSLLRKLSDSANNSEEIIETMYDLQTGTYVNALKTADILSHKKRYGKAIANEILALTKPSSILEAGVGEGTTFSFVLEHLDTTHLQAHGFDISWSRIACCREWLVSQNQSSAKVSTASLLNIPFADNSFDVVYTSHTIEPNGGNEDAILKELYRVTSRYLILLEPGYELASAEAKQRMENHGYCQGLVKKSELQGMKVIKHELFSETGNPLNPTALTIIEKHRDAIDASPSYICPKYKTPLSDYGDSLFSSESIRAYPKIQGIACLRPEDGIIASAYNKYKKTV